MDELLLSVLSQKANVRKALSELRNKGLIYKMSKSPYYALTEKGKRVAECIEVIEEALRE